jgi:FAD/FMN-containing dehydrogenase
MTDEHALHAARVAALGGMVAGAGAADAAHLGLDTRTSNLFRSRKEPAKRRLDVSGFTRVLEIGDGWADVEGMTTYEAALDALLPVGVMPAVVPQLKSITVGGAVAGVGIEATSFRHGLVHDTMLALEVLLPDGRVVRAMPDNEHRDLFFGFPNSYGTLGYALAVRIATIPVRRHVRVEHRPHETLDAFFADLFAACGSRADFVDAVAFSDRSFVVNVATFVDDARSVSDYTFEHIYYRSLLDKPVDHLTARDWIWRWDTDWFWCSKNLYVEHPLVRRLLGRERLNSKTYAKIMRWNARWGVTGLAARLARRTPESVVQDVDLPFAKAPEFLRFLLREVPITPIWLCPIAHHARSWQFPLYPLAPGVDYVNFGFWDVIPDVPDGDPAHYNRLVEREVVREGGIKSLYSDSFFTRDEFDRLYGGDAYRALKAKYDPDGRALGLYEKCVLRR